jgi:hypothetical protein
MPARSEPRQPRPEQAVCGTESWVSDGLLIHGKLMPSGEGFQAQRCIRPEQRCHKGQSYRNHRGHAQKPLYDEPRKEWKDTARRTRPRVHGTPRPAGSQE